MTDPRQGGSSTVTPRARVLLVLGQVAFGVGSYIYLLSAAQALGPQGFATVGLFWSLAFAFGLGLFGPLEIMLAREIASGSYGSSGPRTLRLYGLLTLILSGGALTAALTGSGATRSVGLACAVYAPLLLCAAVQRGSSAGRRSFRSYTAQIWAEGVLRVIVSGLLLFAGVEAEGLWLLALVASTALAVALALIAGDRPPERRSATPQVPWGTTLLNAVVLTAVVGLNIMVANALPASAAILGADAGDLSSLTAASTVLRLPIFFVGLAVAIVVPHISSAPPDGRGGAVRRVVTLTWLVAAPLTLALAILGETALRIAYPDISLIDGRDLVFIAVSTGGLIVASVLSSILVALERTSQAAVAWLMVAVTYLVLMLPPWGSAVHRVCVAAAGAGIVAGLLFTWLTRPSTIARGAARGVMP